MQRVTLQDFRNLQEELLKARQALHDCETTIKRQSAELAKHQAVASLFPVERSRGPTTDGNPFGSNPFGPPSSDAEVQTDACSEITFVEECRPGATGSPAKKDDEVTGTSCTPKAAAATSATPETCVPGSGHRQARSVELTPAMLNALVCLMKRQQERGLARVVFHCWCAAHSSTRILRNMSEMAALMRKQPSGPQYAQSRDDNPSEPSALTTLSMRLAKLEEFRINAEAEKMEAVAAAVAEAKEEGEAAMHAAVENATQLAEARESELQQRAHELEIQLETLHRRMSSERARNAALLQELVRTLSASHARTMTALQSSRHHATGTQAEEGASRIASSSH